MLRAAAVVLSCALAAGCGGGDAGRPTIVAGFYPLAWAAEQVATEGYEVVNLTPAGAEPHDLELSPRDVEKVREAELVLYVGGGFQPALEDAVAERDGPAEDLLSGASDDPHVWLDPVRFARSVARISRALGRAESAGPVLAGLRRLDADYRSGLARCERRTIVTTHAAFGQLARRYGLTELSLAGRSPEAEPSPRELEAFTQRVRDAGATTVFSEPLLSDRLAETVAREVGAKVAVLDPVEGLSEERLAAGEDYLSVMRDNLAVLREALGCR
jgi:zinc transport system substrate-binding protein